MQTTSIEWTDYTANPFKARHKSLTVNVPACPRCLMPAERVGKLFNFCVRVSRGCENCYACTLTHRWGGPDYAAGMEKCLEPVLVEKELKAILNFKGPARTKIFAFDMTDIFFDFWPDEFRDKFFAVAALRPDLIFQLLTKRPERMNQYFGDLDWRGDEIGDAAAELDERFTESGGWNINLENPLENVWLGVSAEDQKNLDERTKWLLKTPAAVRFVSYEPALNAVDFWRIPYPDGPGSALGDGRISWIIVGGESGPGARPFDLQWARDAIRQCREAGIACFYKQGGTSNRCPHDRKGGHFDCFPEDLKVREMPEIAGKVAV